MIAKSSLLVIRLALGVLLVFSAIGKIARPWDFLEAVYDYDMTPMVVGLVLAAALPWLEIVSGLCLLAGLCLGGSLLVTSGLMAAFVFAQSVALLRGLTIGCGCFGGPADRLVSGWTLGFSAALIATAVAGWCCWRVIEERRCAQAPGLDGANG